MRVVVAAICASVVSIGALAQGMSYGHGNESCGK